MQVDKIPVGNVFQFYTNDETILTAFRCKDIEFKHIVSTLLVTNYFLLPKETVVSKICEISEYETGLGNRQSTKMMPPITNGELGTMSPGTICQIQSHVGSSKWIMALKRHAYGCNVVAGIGTPQGLPPTTIIQDLGPMWEYDCIPDFEKEARICPNCHQISLVGKHDEECTCLFCNVKVSFNWTTE